MNINDKTLWVVAPAVRSVRTSDGLTLVDLSRVIYSDLALLAASVWLLIEWTPAGIAVKEIVDLLEQVVSVRRRVLETETCRLVDHLAQNGFLRKRPGFESASERTNAQEQPVGKGTPRSVKTIKDVVWLISDNALATYTQDGAVLLDIPKGTCYTLDEIGSRIWGAMESSPSGITLEGIVAVLEKTIEIPREQLEHDTSEFLQDLELRTLVRWEAQDVSRKIGG